MTRPTSPMPERRDLSIYAADAPEVRADEAGHVLSGYAAIFNRMSADLGGFREIIKSGAFADSLSDGRDVRALVDHDPAKILGRTSAGTLRLREDGVGLADEVDVPDTTYARDLLASVRRKDIRGQSFGFRVLEDEWAYDGDDVLIRTLIKVSLLEVTFTSIPAYGDTTAAARHEILVPDEVRATAERHIADHRRVPRRERAERLLQIAAVA